ncbi:MAG: Wadjet anti-phage system protein JetD domain-containing protein [Bacteroidota bacterium]
MNPSPNIIHDLISAGLSRWKKAYIQLENLYRFVEETKQEINLDLPEGRMSFVQAIQALIDERLLSPVESSSVNSQGLYSKYRLIREKQEDNDIKEEIIRELVSPIKVDYYLSHTGEYRKDRRYIGIISNFLKRGRIDEVSINERAFQLFGDEKFFIGGESGRSPGERILKNLGLSWADLGCYITYEPFFCFFKPDYKKVEIRDVYIIENKDTFWSFKKLLFEHGSWLKADFLIYGEGKKILNSFRFVEEYGLSAHDRYHYFGDLDAEGVNILIRLKQSYQSYDITPFIDAYLRLIDIVQAYRSSKSNQEINPGFIKEFLDFFQPVYHDQMLKILKNGYYIPQESLSLTRLKQYYGKKG